ncbi:hypothetical protein R3P38DRAFT_3170218 [Favolaschia claudopus]|uniref:Uncharacterized protein n=1 Tax=Favolaschia claudopus TaxID=2862362 RepID=A0AAW0DSE4_9AGAR
MTRRWEDEGVLRGGQGGILREEAEEEHTRSAGRRVDAFNGQTTALTSSPSPLFILLLSASSPLRLTSTPPLRRRTHDQDIPRSLPYAPSHPLAVLRYPSRDAGIETSVVAAAFFPLAAINIDIEIDIEAEDAMTTQSRFPDADPAFTFAFDADASACWMSDSPRPSPGAVCLTSLLDDCLAPASLPTYVAQRLTASMAASCVVSWLCSLDDPPPPTHLKRNETISPDSCCAGISFARDSSVRHDHGRPRKQLADWASTSFDIS